MICCASHSAVGCQVTANQSSGRRSWPTTRNANRHSNVTVGTTQRSIAAIASAWLRRKVRQVCDGGPRRRIMYFGDRRFRDLESELEQFTMNARGAPQWVLLAHPSDEFPQLIANSRPSRPTSKFPAPIGPETRSMPPQDCARLNDARQTEQAWPEPRHPDQQRPVTPTKLQTVRCTP